MEKIIKLKNKIKKIIKELDSEQLYSLYDGAGGHIEVVGEIDRLLYDDGGILDDAHSGRLEEWQAEEANDRLKDLDRAGSKEVGQWWWTYPEKEDDYTMTFHVGEGLCINIYNKKITIECLSFEF